MTDDEYMRVIEREFDVRGMKNKGAAVLIGTCVAIIGLIWSCTTHAQTVQAPTRVTTYDWRCADASGAKISDHTRFDTAFITCLNDAKGFEVVGGRYRINRPTAPPPACPAKPADDSQTVQCPAGTTGTWTQTRTYTSAPSPTCWAAGAWTPSAPSAGSCPAVPAGLTSPTLTGVVSAGVNAGRYDIALTWSAIGGATGYEIERCTGVGCTGFKSFGTATPDSQPGQTDSNVPGGFSLSYRVRAKDATTAGPYSNVYTAVTAGATTPPPPTPTTGSATLEWTPPTTNTDNTPLTNLAGYRIEYGLGGALDQVAVVNNPALTSYIVTGLGSGSWSFAVRAYTSGGAVSDRSNVATKSIQ